MVTSTGIIMLDAMFDEEKRKWSRQVMMFPTTTTVRVGSGGALFQIRARRGLVPR